MRASWRSRCASKAAARAISGHRRQRGRGAEPEKSNAQAQAAAGEAAKEIGRQQLPDRMQQSADAMRQASADARGLRGSTAPANPADRVRDQAGAQQEVARSLDRIAEALASGTATDDAESRKLSDQLAKSQELRDRMAATSRDLASANSQNGQNGRGGQRGGQAPGDSQASGGQRSSGDTGKPGQGQQGGGGSGSADATKLREEYMRQMRETKDLIDQIRRDDPSLARGGGGGFTFEEPTSQTVTAPGTEAFKQDFAKWEELRRQATQALDNVESSLSKKLQAKRSKDRLAAGADDKAPAGVQAAGGQYFKAIARRKQ